MAKDKKIIPICADCIHFDINENCSKDKIEAGIDIVTGILTYAGIERCRFQRRIGMGYCGPSGKYFIHK